MFGTLDVDLALEVRDQIEVTLLVNTIAQGVLSAVHHTHGYLNLGEVSRELVIVPVSVLSVVSKPDVFVEVLQKSCRDLFKAIRMLW